MSIGLSFHCLSGCAWRSLKRRRCSSRLTENQNLNRCTPERTRWRSNSGAWRRNSSYSVSLQKPITRSTPARLYQLRSNSTISPRVGRCCDVALEVPLPALDVARLLQRHHARAARVQVLHEALDRAALAGGVAAFEQDHHALPGVLDPGLQLEQLDLQAVLLALVVAARHQVLVRVAAFAPAGGEFGVGVDAGRLTALAVEQQPAQRLDLVG